MKSFGELIKEARLQRKLEQKDVQAETGIDYTLLCRLEKGERKPSREQVYHLADFYNLNRSDLLVIWQSEKILSCFKDHDLKTINKVLDVVKKRLLDISIQDTQQ